MGKPGSILRRGNRARRAACFWRGGARAADSHLRGGVFAPHRLDCGLRPPGSAGVESSAGSEPPLTSMAKADDAVGGSSRPGRKYLTLRSDRCYDFAIGPKVLGSEPKGKRVEFPHGRATVISELAGEAGHCCFRQWEGSRWSVLAVSQETCLGIDEARCARERLGRKYTQVFRTTHPGISLPSAFHLQPCLPMKA